MYAARRGRRYVLGSPAQYWHSPCRWRLRPSRFRDRDPRPSARCRGPAPDRWRRTDSTAVRRLLAALGLAPRAAAGHQPRNPLLTASAALRVTRRRGPASDDGWSTGRATVVRHQERPRARPPGDIRPGVSGPPDGHAPAPVALLLPGSGRPAPARHRRCRHESRPRWRRGTSGSGPIGLPAFPPRCEWSTASAREVRARALGDGSPSIPYPSGQRCRAVSRRSALTEMVVRPSNGAHSRPVERRAEPFPACYHQRLAIPRRPALSRRRSIRVGLRAAPQRPRSRSGPGSVPDGRREHLPAGHAGEADGTRRMRVVTRQARQASLT